MCIRDRGTKDVKLQIWDTAGQDRFRSITGTYYKGAHGIIIVYDVTDRYSFNEIEKWMGQVDKLAPENCVKILVGNKCDLNEKRVVTTDEGKSAAASYNMKYFETSAKKALNVTNVFTALAQDIQSKIFGSKVKSDKKGKAIQINDAKKDAKASKKLKSSKCCNQHICLLYTSPSPRDLSTSRMPSSA
eukprot:TRINITY_DN1722_c0_g1_i1.p1 TRINITY_DN1722_c0_g1~~TRINITY_DN1722_c0_g1_i1.p1  ORF type:complete len:188 (+),score=64.68 TRINITY_DN1722_c0_g1_i1:53-616(+)